MGAEITLCPQGMAEVEANSVELCGSMWVDWAEGGCEWIGMWVDVDGLDWGWR